MKLENLSPAYGSKQSRKRIGRGGKYSKTCFQCGYASKNSFNIGTI